MRSRGVAAVLLALVATAAAWLGWATPAAAGVGESITTYRITLDVRGDGKLAVSEDITYAFAGSGHHGIERVIPTQVPYDRSHDRVYRISDVHVTSPSGAPSKVKRSEANGNTVLRIGDPNRTVSGPQRYVIDYVVDGALNKFPDHVELYWNAIGTEWDVPIDAASVRVTTPAAITQAACFTGAFGSNLPCTGAAVGSDQRSYGVQRSGLQANQALTVVVGLPTGSVTATGPVLVERHTLAKAFEPTVPSGAVAAGLVLVGVGGAIGMTWQKGRDRAYVGLTPGLEPGAGQSEADRRVPLVGKPPVAVQFQPPEGLRPGQVGTLIDEEANVVDVTATIVDLAVRGWLKIHELPREGHFAKRDWLLERLDGDGSTLLQYERTLYNALFAGHDEVKMSDLKQHFSSQLQSVQIELYQDVTKAGWFSGRPDQVRQRWGMLGIVVLAAGAFLTYQLAKRNHWALVGIAVLAVGVAIRFAARRMPARTAKGSAVLAQARGFKLYLSTAEANQIRFEEGQDIFSRYLPYAIVFGEAERWAKIFAQLQAEGRIPMGYAPGWYIGPPGWGFGDFGSSMSGFTTTAAGTMAAATPSSSGGSGFGGGGFSGGGGGGGGGGSW